MSDDLQKAQDYAYRLLGYRPRTCQEIKLKLKEKGFSPDVAEQVIAKLLEYKYLDDREFARIWIQDRCRLKPMGKWRLKQELKLKGINSEIIEEELALLTADMELNLATKLVKSRILKKVHSEKQIISFLVRRGFSGDIITKITAMLED